MSLEVFTTISDRAIERAIPHVKSGPIENPSNKPTESFKNPFAISLLSLPAIFKSVPLGPTKELKNCERTIIKMIHERSFDLQPMKFISLVILTTRKRTIGRTRKAFHLETFIKVSFSAAKFLSRQLIEKPGIATLENAAPKRLPIIPRLRPRDSAPTASSLENVPCSTLENDAYTEYVMAVI